MNRKSIFSRTYSAGFFASVPERDLDQGLAGYVFLRMTPQSKPVRYWAEFEDGLLRLSRDKGKKVLTGADLSFCHLQVRQVVLLGKKYHSLCFRKNRICEKLLVDGEDCANQWVSRLKDHCVFSRFNSAYRCVKVLGKGNFAKVFLVERRADKSLFAAKVFDKKQIAADDNEQKCLLYEVQMLRAVKHSNIIRLEEIFEGENFIYCVCSLYSGGNLLDKVLAQKYFSERQAMVYLRQLLKSLAYLESKCIMHRDLKPENILLKDATEDSELVIVDLGFATYEKDYASLFVRCGTPGYVAPEILADRQYGVKVDVFSVGVILFIMLTGNVPFPNQSYEKLVEANAACEVDFDLSQHGVQVSEAAIGLLKKMLRKDPAKRPFASQLLLDPAFKELSSKLPAASSHKPASFASNIALDAPQ